MHWEESVAEHVPAEELLDEEELMVLFVTDEELEVVADVYRTKKLSATTVKIVLIYLLVLLDFIILVLGNKR